MSLRTLAAISGLGRALLGAAFAVAPARTGSSWIGNPAEDQRVEVLTRAVGARDFALGVGTARAIAEDEGASAWLLASAAADSVDLTATLLARDELPDRSVAITIGLAGGSALLCLAAALLGD